MAVQLRVVSQSDPAVWEQLPLGRGREPRQQQVRKLPGCWAVGMEIESQGGWKGIGRGPAWLSDTTEMPPERRGWVGAGV